VFLFRTGRNASGKLGGFESMTSTQEQAAKYFSGREGARKFAFSKIWGDELHDVFSDVAPYYDVASNVASLGLCKTWRRKFVNAVEIRPGDEVLDLCAGTNAVGIALLRREPAARVRSFDRNAAMQEVGGKLARAQGFEIESHIGDAHRLPFPDASFDIVDPAVGVPAPAGGRGVLRGPAGAQARWHLLSLRHAAPGKLCRAGPLQRLSEDLRVGDRADLP
jgi:hypothetical protein